jgi:hypothetical protein
LVSFIGSDAGWLVDAAGWFVEDEAAWLVEADAAWLVDAAGWFTEAEVAGWLVDADAAGWFAEAEDGLDDAEALATEFRPGTSAFACFAWSMAAWVRGPMMPSTGPGSKPLSFSACCSWRTDSSPAAWLPLILLESDLLESDAPLVELADAPLVEAEDAGWLVEDAAMLDDAGWLVDAVAAGWFAEAEAAGWFAEADFSVLDWPAAIAVPAAIRAATRASFLNFMVVFLSSYTAGTEIQRQLTCNPFRSSRGDQVASRGCSERRKTFIRRRRGRTT